MVAFPGNVTFQFIDTASKVPTADLVILLTLFAHRKNDYHVGPFTTDTEGKIVVTKDDCLKTISDLKTLFLMDYASSLDECLPKVAVEIMSRQGIESLMKVRRDYKDLFENVADCSESFLQRFATVTNDQYLSDTLTFEEAQLHRPGPIVIPVRRRPGNAGT